MKKPSRREFQTWYVKFSIKTALTVISPLFMYWLALGVIPWNYLASSLALTFVPLALVHMDEDHESSWLLLVFGSWAAMMYWHPEIFSIPIIPDITEGLSLLQIGALLSMVTRPFVMLPQIFGYWAVRLVDR